MATLPTTASLTGAQTTNAQQKTNFTSLRDFLSDLFGTDSSNKAAARTALGVPALTDFASQLGSPGYQKLLSGLILQWGQTTASSGGSVVVTFPIAFPTQQFWNGAMLLSTSVASAFIVGSDVGSVTQMTIQAGNTSGQGVAANVKWLALGR